MKTAIYNDIKVRNKPSFYATPVAWAVANFTQMLIEDEGGIVPHHTGMIVVSDECSLSTIRDISRTAADGTISPLRFAGASPSIVAGLPALEQGIRGPTVCLTMPPGHAANAIVAMIDYWIRYNNIVSVIVIAHYRQGESRHIFKGLIARSTTKITSDRIKEIFTGLTGDGVSMCGEERIVEILNSHYGTTSLLNYSESEDEIRFQLPAPITDTQAAVFRSRAKVLNELAISHRLSLLLGRDKYGVPEDFAFAIKSLESEAHSNDVVDAYHVSLRFEVLNRRRDTITALRSTLVTQYSAETRRTVTSFNVLPPSLANFVRRSRQFLDFSDVKMSRDKSSISTVADNHFKYYPSEVDRLSDGRRVDHVPALTLIDIALSVNKMADSSNISADFLNYTDPRQSFDILQKKDHRATEFVQNGQLVAIVHDRGSNPPLAIQQSGRRIAR